MMQVLLLGGSGLLGHNVLKLLVEQHFQVRCLLRRPIHFPFPTPDVDFLQGSPLNDGDLCRAMEGCAAVINCAGTTDMSLFRQEDYYPVNRDLCRRLVEQMEQHPLLHTLIHVSTANTIGYGSPDYPADVSKPMQEPFISSYYAQSKREGEEILQMAAARRTDKRLVILNPGFMIGPYDVKPSSGKLLLSGHKLPIMLAPCGGKCFVPVTEVAAAAVAALTKGVSGERYLVTGVSLSLKEFFLLQAKVCGYRQWVLTLPSQFVLAAARVGDLLRKCGIRTQLSSRNVRQLLVREYYDDSRARQTFNLTPLTPSTLNPQPSTLNPQLYDAICAFYASRSQSQKC